MSIDKRIVKTTASIKNAFMELMIEKEISKISVSDIAERAKINRSTFYLHYSDVVSVMSDIEGEIENEINSCIEDFDINEIKNSALTMFTYLTEILDSNEVLKKYITCSTNHDYVANKIKRIFVEKTSKAIINFRPEIELNEIIYPLTFSASGIVDCYMHWANVSENNVTLEEMLNRVSVIIDYVIKNILST